eukprot:TRINITY_DN16826_c0_g1_i4.p1 TRINITY_DN16826_c0_g1~~TRINITY_DN16826_c0_g1_i4.p1  ORF type:complete len:551 (-),score=15.66 TRINITY_DN16826_c0_g1_i4:154-1806(-)
MEESQNFGSKDLERILRPVHFFWQLCYNQILKIRLEKQLVNNQNLKSFVVIQNNFLVGNQGNKNFVGNLNNTSFVRCWNNNFVGNQIHSMMRTATLNIPQTYICSISQKIMTEPVLVLETGEILDSTSAKDKVYQSQTIIALNDLQQAIKSFLQYQDDNQTGEVVQEEFQCQLQNKNESKDDSFLQIAANYQNKLHEIKAQDFMVMTSQTQLMQLRHEFSSIFYEFQVQIELFSCFYDEIKKLNLHCPAQIIFETRSRLLKFKQNYISSVNNFSYMLLRVYQRKKVFEKNLFQLQVQERDLNVLRQDLQNALNQLHVESRFSTEYSQCSMKYNYYYDINEKQFELMVSGGSVAHVSIDLQSPEQNKIIEVTENLCLRGVKINCNSNNKLKTLQFYLRSKYANIVLQDCRFEGIGVSIFGYKTEQGIFGSASLSNVNIANAAGIGFSISSCKNFKMETTSVSGCQEGSGVSVYKIYNACILKHVQVKNCGYNGIFLQDTEANLSNCTIEDCQRYGLFIQGDNCIIRVEQVQLNNNGSGGVYGHIVEQQSDM